MRRTAQRPVRWGLVQRPPNILWTKRSVQERRHLRSYDTSVRAEQIVDRRVAATSDPGLGKSLDVGLADVFAFGETGSQG